MTRRRTTRLWVAVLAFSAMASAAAAQTRDNADDKKEGKAPAKAPPTILRTQADRADATYSLEEPAGFLLASTTAGEIEYTFTANELKVVNQGKLRVVAGQTYRLQEKVGEPCFLKLQLKQDEATAFAVAAVAPTKIAATAKPPEDFDEFWKARRGELAKVRIDQAVEFWPSESTPTVNVYRVNFASVDDRRVYGWLAAPKGPGPFPAIVTLPHAGVYPVRPDLHHASLGAVSLAISIHDFPVDYPASFYKKQADGPLKNYTRDGWDDRDKCYLRWAILAGVRAVDYVSQRKDVDAKQIAVTGVSQGGGLALCVAGLDDRVGFAAVGVAGLCDLNALSHGRIDGWPHWVAAAPAELKAKVEATSQYFDAVNFARKFRGKSLHGVGFLDAVCPPSTVYAAFNEMPEPKTMIVGANLGHATDPRWLQARDDFWKANLSLKPPPPPKKK